MPIRKIILEKDNYYHIYNRGVDKQIIFRNEKDFERFYKVILRYNKIYDGIKIHSYCFLPNHFHIIISSSKSGLEISDFMRKIQQSYSMYLKKTLSPDLKKKGQVFEGRFKAKLIKDQNYLHKCIAYVNFNALKHKIVENISDYNRTSYHQIDKNKIYKYKDLILEELEY